MATSKHITISRRAALMGGASVVALAGVAGAAVAAVPNIDPHPAWLDQREVQGAIESRVVADSEPPVMMRSDSPERIE